MDNNYKELYEKFLKIKSKGYICSNYKDLGFAGKTFENQLGMKFNKFQRADYKDIEIKVRSDKSTYPLTMFGITPQINNKDYKNSIEYLYKNFSYKSKNNSMIFSCELSGDRYTRIFNEISMKAEVNYESEKIYLKVIENEYSITTNVYWLFNGIEKALIRKMSKLAIIDVNIKDSNMCYYYNIHFYKLKNTDIFFKLIEKGKIIIAFNIKKRNNEIISDGVKFRINMDSLKELYDEIII